MKSSLTRRTFATVLAMVKPWGLSARSGSIHSRQSAPVHSARAAHILNGLRRIRAFDHAKQVILVEAAQRQDHHLKSHCRQVPDHHDNSLSSSSEPTGGVGEKDVQPNGRYQQVAQRTNRVG